MSDIMQRLEKKSTINSWKRHALCDSALSYERNRWKFEHVLRNRNSFWQEEQWWKSKLKTAEIARNYDEHTGCE